MAIDYKRLEISNQVINLLQHSVRIFEKNNRIWVEWESSKGLVTRQWQTHGGSFYPVWSHRFPVGGTYTVAIAQLINWTRDKPCVPIQSWEYWCSETIGMKPKELLNILRHSDYPKEQKCYFCDRQDVQLDWYNFGNKSGLGCLKRCDRLVVLMDREFKR